MPAPRATARPERARLGKGRSSKSRLGVWFELCLVCCIAWARPAQAA